MSAPFVDVPTIAKLNVPLVGTILVTSYSAQTPAVGIGKEAEDVSLHDGRLLYVTELSSQGLVISLSDGAPVVPLSTQIRSVAEMIASLGGMSNFISTEDAGPDCRISKRVSEP